MEKALIYDLNLRMVETPFEAVLLIGLLVATIIRTFYGLQFRRKEIIYAQKEHPVVFVGMTLWGIALILPLISIFTPWLDGADYRIPLPLSVIGGIIFVYGLWLLWRSHNDLQKNFSPLCLYAKIIR